MDWLRATTQEITHPDNRLQIWSAPARRRFGSYRKPERTGAKLPLLTRGLLTLRESGVKPPHSKSLRVSFWRTCELQSKYGTSKDVRRTQSVRLSQAISQRRDARESDLQT